MIRPTPTQAGPCHTNKPPRFRADHRKWRAAGTPSEAVEPGGFAWRRSRGARQSRAPEPWLAAAAGWPGWQPRSAEPALPFRSAPGAVARTRAAAPSSPDYPARARSGFRDEPAALRPHFLASRVAQGLQRQAG